MRRSLLATTAIAALVLGAAPVLAQVQPSGPSGALQEEPRNKEQGPKAGKSMNQAPAHTAPGRSAQTQTPSETQPQAPGGKQQRHLQGQAQPQTQGPREQQRVQGQAQPQGPRNQETLQGQTQRPAGTTGAARGTQVQVTQQQRTQIHEHFAHFRGERIEHPQFSVSVGVVIPRTVHIQVLPAAIVEIVPEYRGYDYVLVGDEVVIIDPDTLEIVAVIPA